MNSIPGSLSKVLSVRELSPVAPMLDFSSVKSGNIELSDLAAILTKADLNRLTNEMVDSMLEMIANCDDNDIVFVPDDPEAIDPDAESIEDVHLSWTLGHVIAHTTASAEESAAIAAELARGVEYRGGRSRREVPWQSMKTMAQCRHRLEESRRMRLASLDMWPDNPDLDNTYTSRKGAPINATLRFLFGLIHDDSHLEQIAQIVAQATSAHPTILES